MPQTTTFNLSLKKQLFKPYVFLISLVISSTCFSQNKINTTTSNSLIIKTIVANGSTKENEFGNRSDWIEIFNTSEDTIDLSLKKWFITDNSKRLKKYRLPSIIINPKSSIILWCDDEAKVRKQIHTNFKLSSYGESITLSCKDGKNLKIIDNITYENFSKNEQMGLLRTDSGLIFKQLSTF